MIKLQSASDQMAQKANAVASAIGNLGNNAPAQVEKVTQAVDESKERLRITIRRTLKKISKRIRLHKNSKQTACVDQRRHISYLDSYTCN